MAEGVLVGRHNAQALDAIVRQWEANGRRLDSARAMSTSTSTSAPICQAIEVTSGTADADGYPARIQLFDGTTWTDSYAECRAVKIGGGVLAVGFYPPGRLMRVADSGLHVYGVHPGAAASGGTELKGLTFTSDTGSTADSDPGNGLFKWNNATQASATVLYFDNQTADAIACNTFWASLGSSGFIFLVQSDDATKWQMWQWSGKPADGTGYYKFTVTHHSSNGSIADNKTVYTSFIGIPDASATVAGGVNLLAQKLGAGEKHVDELRIGNRFHAEDFAAPGAGYPDGTGIQDGDGSGPATLIMREGGTFWLLETNEDYGCNFSSSGGDGGFDATAIDLATGNPVTGNTLSYEANGRLKAKQLNQYSGNAPASAGATGTTGDFAWDSSFFYVCTATDTWKRVAIATW